MPKRIETTVTAGRNGGIHDTKSYKKACNWLDTHTFTNAQLWHLVLTPHKDKTLGTPTRNDFETALDRLAEKLRDAGMPTEYKAAYEQCPTKGFHRHCFLLIDASKHKPAAVLRWKENGWLVDMLKGFKLGFYLARPQGDIHLTRKGKSKKYAYVPKTPGPMLDDCKVWVSYIYKCRTKEDVAAPIYSSSRKRATAKQPSTIKETTQ